MKTKLITVLILVIAFLSDIATANGNFNITHLNNETDSIGLSISRLKKETPAMTYAMDQTIPAQAIEVDSPIAKEIPIDTNYKAPEGFKTRMPQALIVPAILIGWGASTIGNNGLYSSHKARTDLLNFTKGKGGPIDNYLIFSPYIEFGALLLFKVKCNSDFINTTLLIAKSEALMLAIVEPMKLITKEERPDKSNTQSMPSGHTAEAFVAATVVYREYRYLSPWYGIGAYALASTVGVFRMINDKHWESDVFIGAGIGMLCTNVVYATHQHRWGRNGVCFSPMYDGKVKGATFALSF